MLEEVEDFRGEDHNAVPLQLAIRGAATEHDLALYWTGLLERLVEDDEQAALQLFSHVLNHESQKPVELSKADLLNLVPLIASVFIAITSSLVYVTPALDAAAKGLPWVLAYFNSELQYIDVAIDTPMNPLSSTLVNIFINVYFGNKLLMSLWQQLIESAIKPLLRNIIGLPHSDYYKSLRILHNKDDSAKGRALRYAKYAGKFLLYGFPALISAAPMYLLDLQTGVNPPFINTMVLISYTILAINGVGIFVEKLTPLIAPIFRTPYNYCRPAAGKRYRLQNDIETLKAAHLSVLIAALVTITDLTQKEEYQTLRPLFNLLQKSKTNPVHAKELYLRILILAQFHEPGKINKIFRFVVQFLGIVGNGFSLLGYYGSTKSGVELFVKNFFGADLSIAGQHVLTTLLMAPMTALTSDVCADVVGEIYDGTVHIGKNVIRNRRDQEQHEQLGLTYMSAWNPIVRLPLAVQQNPKIMLGLLYALTIFTYWSTATSLELNSEYLSTAWAIGVAAPTIIFGILFNSFAFKPLLYDVQKLGVRTFGDPENKQELRLEDFVKDAINAWQGFDGEQILKILLDFTYEPVDSKGTHHSNKIINHCFFAQTPVQIFGDNHRFAEETDMREVIASLANEADVWPANRQRTRPTFFGQQQDTTKLLPRDRTVNTDPIFDTL